MNPRAASEALRRRRMTLPLQIDIEGTRERRIAAPLGKSNHLEDAHRPVEPDGKHVTCFDRMTGRSLAHAIDAHMARLHQSGSAGAGFHQPRMP